MPFGIIWHNFFGDIGVSSGKRKLTYAEAFQESSDANRQKPESVNSLIVI